MRVIHSLGWFLPESTGGTETYVAGLCAELAMLDIEVKIAAASDGSYERNYDFNGISVYRYPVTSERNMAQQIGHEPHDGFQRFTYWLERQQADIYHQHSWTYGCGLHHLRAARELGIATVLTVHVPGPVCLRGTMLRDGREPCTGVITLRHCASCWLQARGMPLGARNLLSGLAPSIGRRTRALGRFGTAMAATELVDRHLSFLLEAAKISDQVVAVCQWLYDALLANGVPQHKLVLNRQGVNVAAPRLPKPDRSTGPLRLGFLGRWDPAKGIDKLVKAVISLPASIQLDLQIRAVEPHDPGMRAHMVDTCRAAEADSRIRILGPIPGDAVPGFLRSIDLLAVPSQWFETGPLVVLEAFAVGTPVIGSRLGGIAELVQHGQNGWLVDYNDTAAWAAAIRLLATDHSLLHHLQQGIGPVRTIQDVAQETKRLYPKLLASAASRS